MNNTKRIQAEGLLSFFKFTLKNAGIETLSPKLLEMSFKGMLEDEALENYAGMWALGYSVALTGDVLLDESLTNDELLEAILTLYSEEQE